MKNYYLRICEYIMFSWLISGLLLPGMVYSQQSVTPASSRVQIGDPEVEPYPFKPGDALFISVFPDTSSFLNGTYPIDDRGFAEFPIIGKMNVSKMTIIELKDVLKATFKSYLRSTDMYIKPLIRVSLTGGFFRPGLYYVDYNSSVWELIRRGGGPTLDEGLYAITWQRDGDDIDDLMPYFEKGVSLKKMGFKSGDQIWTPNLPPRTFWDITRDLLPILTFATTIMLTYYTIQTNFIYLQSGRRN